MDMVRALVTLCLAAAGAVAQTPSDVVFRQQFQADTEGWVAIGDGATVSVEPAEPGAGDTSGKLIFSYERAAGKHAGAILRAPDGFDRARTLRLRLRSDRPTAFALLLSEKKPGGGNYAAWFSVPGAAMQTIELSPADFTVTDGAGDPVDSDGKLDLDAVEGIGLFDLSQFLPNNEGLERNTVAIEEFEILSTPPGSAYTGWVALGSMKMKPLPGGVEAAYRQTEGQLDLLVRRVAPSQALPARLSFDVASKEECTLVVALEMKKTGGGQGPRFTLPIYPPGGNESFHVDLKLADFQGDGTFDPAQWKSLAIVAIEPEANTFQVTNLKIDR